jgi:hypothetical protein
MVVSNWDWAPAGTADCRSGRFQARPNGRAIPRGGGGGRPLANDESSYAGRYYQLHQAFDRDPSSLGRRWSCRTPARCSDRGVRRHLNSFGTVDEMRTRNAMLDEHCLASGATRTIRRSLYAGGR